MLASLAPSIRNHAMPQPIDFTTQAWWPHCVSLAEVIRRVGSKERRDKIDALEKEASCLTLCERVKNLDDPRAGLMGEITRMSQLGSEYRALMDGQKRAVIAGIRNGQLRAFGYQFPRGASDIPVEVPVDLWTGGVHWEGSTVERDGLKIVSVRVTTTEAIQASMRTHHTATPVGRPSRKSEIIEAYEHLLRTGELDPTTAQSETAKAIRARINSRSPGSMDQDSGLTDETIRRTIKKWQAQNTKS